MTAADIYLSAMKGWKAPQEKKRLESEEQKKSHGQVVSLEEARLRLRAAPCRG